MKKIFVFLLVALSFASWAGDFQDGVAAYDKKDYKTALTKFKAEAEKGDAFVQLMVGDMYNEGLGIKKDYAEAMRWYRLAAEQGGSFAQFNLGAMYDNGQGVVQDYEEALRWYKLAAEQGHASAQFNWHSPKTLDISHCTV
jgi:hypothetical protein